MIRSGRIADVCGRFVTASSPALIADRFAVDEIDATVAPDPEPDYNVSPRRNVLAVREQAVEDGDPSGCCLASGGAWCPRGPRRSRSATG